MAKVWKDVNEVVRMVHDLEDERLRSLDREMTKKPNFDKKEIKKKIKKKRKNKRGCE